MIGSHDVPSAAPAPRSQALLAVEGLCINSRVDGRVRTILRDVSLSVAAGEAVAIVGESGSGKSMLTRALVGLLPDGLSASGSITYRGASVSFTSRRQWKTLRGREISLVLQDPFTMLDPLVRCGAQIEETWRLSHTGSRPERRAEVVRRLDEVGISDPRTVERYPFELSGGMRQRVGMAAALAQDPQLLIADEPSTALDVTTQAEVLALLQQLRASRQMSLILITHDLRVAFATCDRVFVLYAGMLLEAADARDLEVEPLHPYSLGLLLSEPDLLERVELNGIPGAVPRPDDVEHMCSFAPRCRWVADVCRAARPPFTEHEAGRFSACARLTEIRPELASAMRHQRKRRVMQTSRSAQHVIEIVGLEKTFAARGRRGSLSLVESLKGVSLEVGDAESVGLVGESGSGKTTLARCLVGLETPTRGEMVVAGVRYGDFGRLSKHERAKVRSHVQMVFQDPYSSLNPARTVGATLTEAAAISRAAPTPSVADLLTLVGLSSTYARRKPSALSGGERQRVAIARSLAVAPRLLICDEPVSALDVSVQAQILELFLRLRAELRLSYLFISHDLSVIRQVADRVYVLQAGVIVEHGPTDKVLGDPQHPYTRSLLASVPRRREASQTVDP